MKNVGYFLLSCFILLSVSACTQKENEKSSVVEEMEKAKEEDSLYAMYTDLDAVNAEIADVTKELSIHRSEIKKMDIEVEGLRFISPSDYHRVAGRRNEIQNLVYKLQTKLGMLLAKKNKMEKSSKDMKENHNVE